MAADTFSAAVSKWVAQSERRMEVVFKESAQDVISEMQEVGPSVANPDSSGTGHMPVDTGFLRASLQAAINSPAQGMEFREPLSKSATYDPSPVALVIAGAKLGDTVYATYAAAYAPQMEAKYGFVRLSAQNWQSIVNKRAAIVKRRVTAALDAARARQ
jgi:hypothetical protein